MSREYPCIYFEKDGKCRKFSDDNTLSYCVMGPCQEQTLSNADRIRAMSDKDLARELALIAEWDRKQLQKAKSGPGLVEFIEHWLQQPAEEDDDEN